MTNAAKTAADLLRSARENNPGRTFGNAKDAETGAVVAYDRPARRYEVGTDAKLCKIGKRADVLPTLRAILDGAYSEDAIASHIAAQLDGRV